MRVVSFVNMKGGVAKTTLAVNVADCLARRNDRKVLLVDIDPQFNATQCLVSGDRYVRGLEEGRQTIIQVFDDAPRPVAGSVGGPAVADPVSIEDVVPWEINPQLHLLPGHLELHRLEMGGGQGREHRLRRLVEHYREHADYDYVIIDTPPTPSAWMSSALIASDHYLVPVKPEPLSATGIDLLRSVVNRVKENYALNIRCAGVVITMAEEETIVFRQAVAYIDNNEFWRGKRFRFVLPKRTEVAKMQRYQGLILDSRDDTLKRSLVSITREFLSRVGDDE